MNFQKRILETTGKTIHVLSTFTLYDQPYCHVLIPYSDIEARLSRRNKKCHLQIVRENKLIPRCN